MPDLRLRLPDDLSQAIRLTPEEVEAEVRLMAALKMFELGKLSSGKAASLAGMSRPDFFGACSRYQVSVPGVDGEVADELRSDLEALKRDPDSP